MNRDLNWLLSSPMLMDVPEQLDGQLWLRSIVDPELTDSSPIPAVTHRLGSHYENLVEFGLSKSAYPIEVKRNIPIRESKITLGEFDFLISDGVQTVHLECAVKFYLLCGEATQLANYIGPMKRDRLDIKWQKMYGKQINLSSTEAGLACCKQLNLPSPEMIQRKLLIQGYLFYPFPMQEIDRIHKGIHAQHNRGWWLYQRQLNELASNQSLQFVIMQKPFWLSVNTDQVLTMAELQEKLANLERPTLISRGVKQNEDWLETDRGFVVPNDW